MKTQAKNLSGFDIPTVGDPITLPDKIRLDAIWVSLAARDYAELGRPRDLATNAIKIEDGKAIATDGKRLHIATGFDALENGFYTFQKVKSKIEAQRWEFPGWIRFPAWEQVVPDPEEMKQVNSRFNAITPDQLAFKIASAGVCVKYHYLVDAAIGGASSGSKVTVNAFVHPDDPANHPITIQTGNRFALIMPIRIDGLV